MTVFKSLSDAIYPETGPPLQDILGGAGSYATVGARLFCHGDASIGVGFVVHAGNELSQKLRDEIVSWKTGTHIIETPNRMTTRGKNVYVDGIRREQIPLETSRSGSLSNPFLLTRFRILYTKNPS